MAEGGNGGSLLPPEPPGEAGFGLADFRSAAAKLIRLALEEDLGEAGDVTSRLTIAADLVSRARIVARQEGMVSGLFVAMMVVFAVDRECRFEACLNERDAFEPGAVLAELEGPSRSLLAAERTMLNFLQRLCGIATRTRRFVDRLEGTGVRLLDTRKTTPGWRLLEKYAVRSGGGDSHRMGLHDMILIKDNHIAAAGGVAPALAAARAGRPAGMPIEIEVARLEDLASALAGEPDGILLDNMRPEEVRAAVGIIHAAPVPPWIEVSGGITLETIRDYAIPGVDYISSGSLTHSATAVDLALDFEDARPGAGAMES